jgi:hypothetical protein
VYVDFVAPDEATEDVWNALARSGDHLSDRSILDFLFDRGNVILSKCRATKSRI